MLKTASIGLMATNVWLTPFMLQDHTAAERQILWKKQLAKLSSVNDNMWTALLLPKQKSSPFHQLGSNCIA
jgi:hypothetical protein